MLFWYFFNLNFILNDGIHFFLIWIFSLFITIFFFKFYQYFSISFISNIFQLEYFYF